MRPVGILVRSDPVKGSPDGLLARQAHGVFICRIDVDDSAFEVGDHHGLHRAPDDFGVDRQVTLGVVAALDLRSKLVIRSCHCLLLVSQLPQRLPERIDCLRDAFHFTLGVQRNDRPRPRAEIAQSCDLRLESTRHEPGEDQGQCDEQSRRREAGQGNECRACLAVPNPCANL